MSGATLPLLARRLTLERAVAVADGGGGTSVAWMAVGHHWAEVSAEAGKAVESGGVEVSRVTHRITVWATPHGAPSRPTAGDRFREGRRLFRLLTVAEADATGRFLTCSAEEEATR